MRELVARNSLYMWTLRRFRTEIKSIKSQYAHGHLSREEYSERLLKLDKIYKRLKQEDKYMFSNGF
jgi:hypothetical protein